VSVEIDDFIAARLGEEEAAALAEGHYDPDEGGYFACPVAQIAAFGRPAEDSDGTCTCGLAERREMALARVAALRALVGELSSVLDERSYANADEEARSWARQETAAGAQRHVAAIWNWHGDYDERWRPVNDSVEEGAK
jgi:hypothetical protein